MDLPDKIALVTGAAAGLGAEITGKLLEGGAKVLAVDLDAAALDTLKQRHLAYGSKIAVFAGDVSDRDGVEAMVEHGERTLGPIGILINNAAIMDKDQGVGELDLNLWYKVLAVNLTAPMLLMRALVPKMAAAGRGAIVNIASSAALRGAAAGAAYTASKHALVGLTRNTAWLYGPRGIRCNAVAPGGMKTNMTGAAPAQASHSARQLAKVRDSMPETLQVADVASAAVFLASDAACAINGAVLAADDGWTAA